MLSVRAPEFPGSVAAGDGLLISGEIKHRAVR
jgi:hypothetical protein